MRDKAEEAKEEAEISSETQKSCKVHRTFHEESVTAECHVPQPDSEVEWKE